MVVPAASAEEEIWGTWEELILGGAVLRHGPRQWNAVAAELQSRALSPSNFTPQVCKAKYEDLQRHYSGYTSWFEELKKRRVVELKKALQKSEDSIGSLESKLEALKAEKTCSNLDYSFKHANSAMQFQKFEIGEYLEKEASKDGLSAGSFTEECQPHSSIHSLPRVKVSEDEVRTLPSASDTQLQGENFPCMVKLSDALPLECGFSIRKKRGERKRKGWDVKEACIGENSTRGSGTADARDKEPLDSDCDRPLYVETSCSSDDQAQCSSQGGLDRLMVILKIVLEDEQSSVFQRRMDGQKRARYRKLIRQHMDLDTIRWRIRNKSITNEREVFRDLLLVANNALVFYSKSTREYKCGLALRKLVSWELRKRDVSINGDKVSPVMARATGAQAKAPEKKRKRPRPRAAD